MKNIIAMAVFIKDGKVLIEKRKKDEDNYAGLWAFPGGHKNKEEKIEETLLREMNEELNIDISSYKFIGTFENIDPTSKESYQHNAFLCDRWSGKITETEEEEGIKWIEIEEIKELKDVSKPTLQVLEKLKDMV
ncbi:NUDIX domain-containing protein [Candidatus Woesearchaeota archaeon]|nr:NUDIX domain-containing protein [Candidatus Woesearchaeota archaeon]